MDVREPLQIKQYRPLTEVEIGDLPGHMSELPADLQSYLNAVGSLGNDGVYGQREAGEQNAAQEQQPQEQNAERQSEEYERQWQIVKDDQGNWVQVPSRNVARWSTFDKVIGPTCCGQKQNEQEYRDSISRIFQGLKGWVPENQDQMSENRDQAPEKQDDEEFLTLVKNKRLLAANSDAYNRVLKAAETFHRQLLRGNLEERRLESDAKALYEVCRAYIEGHPSPVFQIGMDRRNLIIALQKKAEDIIVYEHTVRYENARNRDAALCAERILAQRDSERRDELIDTVEAVILSWSHQEDDALKQSIRACMLGDRKQIAEKYLHYLFPDCETKLLRADKESQECMLKDLGTDKLSARIKRFMTAVDETMSDIVYWAGRIGATSVKEVELTGSDYHERGIGVIIVTYKTDAGDQKKVLKPEEKWAEYELLRKTPAAEAAAGKESVAERLNKLVDEHKVRVLQADGTQRALSGCKIRTIDMQVEKGHGTMVEFTEHVQENQLLEYAQAMPGQAAERQVAAGEEDKKAIIERALDVDQVLLTQAFCMLVGMADMHYENLVYERTGTDDNPKYHAVMIDADNALSNQILGNVRAGSQSDLVKNYLEGRNIVIDGISELAELVAEKLSRVVVRTVPIVTAKLEEYRALIQSYTNIQEIIDTIKSMNPDDLKHGIRAMRKKCNPEDEQLERLNKAEILYYNRSLFHGADKFLDLGKKLRNPDKSPGLSKVLAGVEMTPEQEQAALVCALEDFLAGQIPFYEFHPGTGLVTTHRGKVVVATARRVQDMKALMIKAFSPQNAGLDGAPDMGEQS